MMPFSIPSKLRRPALRGRRGGALQRAMTAFLLLLPSFALPQGKPTDYEVKAAYVFNFGKFMRVAGVENTAPRRPTFDICILGRGPIGQVLDDITAKESIENRAVRVVRAPDAHAARTCEILFISSEEGDGIRADLVALGEADVLTVSDAPDFLKDGGMIQFVMRQSHVRFAVNLDAVDHTHLILSSELLRVALSVTGKPREVQP
jgi:hypothetical protein